MSAHGRSEALIPQRAVRRVPMSASIRLRLESLARSTKVAG
jgi:hypothetical protein